MNSQYSNHPGLDLQNRAMTVQTVDSPQLYADMSSNNDSSYTDTSMQYHNNNNIVLETTHLEITDKRKRGRPRKYPCLANNGKTFNCVATSRFLVYPKNSPLIKNHMLVVAKLVYHRSYNNKFLV